MTFSPRDLRSDLPASFVVFLVALPLSLGIALASGAPAKAGLIAVVVGGIVVGLTGGSPLQVSGPAAGLTALVYGMVEKFGFETTCVITALAGLFQLALGALGAARLALAIAPAVLHALLAGIGVLIALAQAHILLGLGPRGSAIANITALPSALSQLNPGALVSGGVTLFTLYSWDRWLTPKLRAVPGTLVAAVAGTLFSLLLPAESLGRMPRVTIDPNLFGLPQLPVLSSLPFQEVVIAAFGLMIVASAESLLSALATDRLHSGPRANLDRELVGQGLGNLISGVLSGLPITGVIVRSSANIASGAKSRLSAILHGLWILVFATSFAVVLQQIPLAVLAALLIAIGLQLVKIHEFRKLAEFRQGGIYLATLAGVVFLNPLWGIAVGLGWALFSLLREASRIDVQLSEVNGELQLLLSGSLTFLSVPALSARLRAIPAGRTINVVLRLDRLDHAAMEALWNWKQSYERQGGRVIKRDLEELWRELRGARTPQRAPGPAP
jgi:carbonic anhydrase